MEETIRQRMRSELSAGEPLSAKELSKILSIREKEVYDHLEHVARSVQRGARFVQEPSTCLSCGFVFKKRTRLKSPSRCPICRSEEITEPLYSIEEG